MGETSEAIKIPAAERVPGVMRAADYMLLRMMQFILYLRKPALSNNYMVQPLNTIEEMAVVYIFACSSKKSKSGGKSRKKVFARWCLLLWKPGWWALLHE